MTFVAVTCGQSAKQYWLFLIQFKAPHMIFIGANGSHRVGLCGSCASLPAESEHWTNKSWIHNNDVSLAACSSCFILAPGVSWSLRLIALLNCHCLEGILHFKRLTNLSGLDLHWILTAPDMATSIITKFWVLWFHMCHYTFCVLGKV